MQLVNPLSLLLILVTLVGYVYLSLWVVFINEHNNNSKRIWTFIILLMPFIGSTIYFVNHLTKVDLPKVPSSK
ncbi:PLDc N-terminal domain-containing protein [Lacinutrix chionoecetis]